MCLFPKEDYKSAYDVPFEQLYDRGVRGVIFDIDNTLVLHDEPADKRCLDFIGELKNMGFIIYIVSNNGEKRVKDFCDSLAVSYICNAHKPKKDSFIKAVYKMNVGLDRCVAIGDQIFTDIWGANNAEVYSILVKPLGREKYFHIVLKRILEFPVLLLYRFFSIKS